MSSVPLVTIKYDVLYDIFFPLWGREVLYIAVRFFYFFYFLEYVYYENVTCFDILILRLFEGIT